MLHVAEVAAQNVRPAIHEYPPVGVPLAFLRLVVTLESLLCANHLGLSTLILPLERSVSERVSDPMTLGHKRVFLLLALAASVDSYSFLSCVDYDRTQDICYGKLLLTCS